MKRLILATALSLLAFSAFADTATLSWTAPTQREDNTPLTLAELREFRIYWGPDNTFTNTVVVSDPTLTTYVIDGLTAGLWSFRMTAVDTDGLESGYSAVATKTVVDTGPNPPRPPVVTGVD
jgi:hypothetical protein